MQLTTPTGSLVQLLPYEIVETKGGLTPADYRLKRLVDIGLLLFALPILLPFMLLIAIAIKLDSKGSFIFMQERVGAVPRLLNGQLVWEPCIFNVFKFRTMFADSDQSLHVKHIRQFVAGTLEGEEETDAPFKLGDDPRITRVGAFLRQTSLDELPQLFNVLRGEMSLVGPRPVPVYEVAEYHDWHYERLATLPGVTGLWQVEGRGRTTFDEMMKMDIGYVRRQSFWLDLRLLVLTVPAVLTGDGAR